MIPLHVINLHFTVSAVFIAGSLDPQSEVTAPLFSLFGFGLLFNPLFLCVDLQGWDAIEWIIQNSERENVPLCDIY